MVVLMGGPSAEHPISLRSAATVVGALRAGGHHVTTVGIAKNGCWRSADFTDLLADARTSLVEVGADTGDPVSPVWRGNRAVIASSDDPSSAVLQDIDVVFPVLHGPGGEDGRIQGLLDSLGFAYVGSGCQASALAMDKLAMKLLCAGAGVPQADFIEAGTAGADELAARVAASFGFPCFIKPCNLGSSVGITKATGARDLGKGLELARSFDPRVIIERAIDAREVEVAVLDAAPASVSTEIDVSPPGEIVPAGEFYDFDAKYVHDDAELIAPAKIDPAIHRQLGQYAREIWRLVGCKGLARVDFFVEHQTGQVLFNEINTLPGFTEISMFPRLWKEGGLGPTELFDRIVRKAASEKTPI